MIRVTTAPACWTALGTVSGGELRVLDAPVAVLGEAPVWNDRAQRLTWVDCDQRRLFALDPAAGTCSARSLAGNPGSYAHRADGGMILAYRNRLCLRDADGNEQDIAADDADFAVERFNDGACDRAGRFWVGSMHPRMAEASGGLFRIDADLQPVRVASGMTVSNGIAFSPDDGFMYHTDSRAPAIFRYDYDLESGGIAGRRVFVDFSDGPYRPDGCTVDRDGHLWVAVVGAGQIRRYDPQGRLVMAVDLPVTRPTSVAFGAADLSTLYVTTMRHALTEDEALRQPHAGCLFAWQSDFAGLAEPFFGTGHELREKG